MSSADKTNVFFCEWANKGQSVDLLSRLFEVPVQRQKTIGIYFLLKKQKVVYVGQSTDLFFRSQSHGRTTGCEHKNFDRILGLCCEPVHLDILESAFIGKLKPKYNGIKNKIRHSCGEYSAKNRHAFENADEVLSKYFNKSSEATCP